MTGDAPSQDPTGLQRRIDSGRAHPARVHDVFPGGRDHCPADLSAAAAGPAANPRGYPDVRHSRDFPRRAVNTPVTDDGINVYGAVATKGRDGPGCPDRGKPCVEGTQFPRLRARVVTADRGAVP